jgi:hypothetical protein
MTDQYMSQRCLVTNVTMAEQNEAIFAAEHLLNVKRIESYRLLNEAFLTHQKEVRSEIKYDGLTSADISQLAHAWMYNCLPGRVLSGFDTGNDWCDAIQSMKVANKIRARTRNEQFRAGFTTSIEGTRQAPHLRNIGRFRRRERKAHKENVIGDYLHSKWFKPPATCEEDLPARDLECLYTTNRILACGKCLRVIGCSKLQYLYDLWDGRVSIGKHGESQVLFISCEEFRLPCRMYMTPAQLETAWLGSGRWSMVPLPQAIRMLDWTGVILVPSPNQTMKLELIFGPVWVANQLDYKCTPMLIMATGTRNTSWSESQDFLGAISAAGYSTDPYLPQLLNMDYLGSNDQITTLGLLSFVKRRYRPYCSDYVEVQSTFYELLQEGRLAFPCESLRVNRWATYRSVGALAALQDTARAVYDLDVTRELTFLLSTVDTRFEDTVPGLLSDMQHRVQEAVETFPELVQTVNNLVNANDHLVHPIGVADVFVDLDD